MSPIIGICGVVFCLYFVFTYPSAGFAGFFDIPSMVLLGVCPPCVMLLSHSIGDFITGFQTLIKAAFTRQSSLEAGVINTLTKASALVRSEGIGSLVKIRNQIKYDLLKDGVSLIVNDFSAEEIRHNISNKINAKQQRMALAGNLFENMSKLCPGVGMIGTLIGLISMLSVLTDPTKIGGGMALAMITTLYGLLLGSFLYGPMSEKIALEAERSLEIDQLVLEGVMSLKGKKSSVHLNDIMKTYGSGSKKGKGVPPQGGGGGGRRRA